MFKLVLHASDSQKTLRTDLPCLQLYTSLSACRNGIMNRNIDHLCFVYRFIASTDYNPVWRVLCLWLYSPFSEQARLTCEESLCVKIFTTWNWTCNLTCSLSQQVFQKRAHMKQENTTRDSRHCLSYNSLYPNKAPDLKINHRENGLRLAKKD